MTKKRVHEIAKEQGLSSKELLEKLKAAGVEAKAAASSIDEAVALKALGGANGAVSNGAPAAPAERQGPAASAQAAATAGAAAAKPSTPPATAASGGTQPPASQAGSDAESAPDSSSPAQQAGERVRPTRDSRTGERTPGGVGPGGRRRVVIDSQASRRQQGGPSNQPQRLAAPRAAPARHL